MADEVLPSIPALQPRLKARLMVKHYVDNHLIDPGGVKGGIDADQDIYVVWFCKTLQNWKALLSTTLPDGMYYEVTYDGDKCQAYLDAYKKFQNMGFTDEDIANI